MKPKKVILEGLDCFSHPYKSFNVWWNKDYTIEANWLAGKPVGGA